MDDLIAWLRATIVGDRAAAEAAVPGPWITYFDDTWVGDVGPIPGGFPNVGITDSIPEEAEIGAELHAANTRHIAIHDPQDTIARCEAELAELDAITGMPHHACLIDEPDDEGTTCSCGRDSLADRLLRIKAHGYRHRSGWQEGWAP